MFGKKPITETQATKHFLDEVIPGALQAWPHLCNRMAGTESAFRNLAHDKAAAFEFALALLSVQIRALNSLSPADQAERIKQYIFASISNPPKDIVVSPLLPDGGPKLTIDTMGFYADEDRDPNADVTNYPGQSIELYTRVFDLAIDDGDLVTSGPAALLGMRLGLLTKQQPNRPVIIQPLFQVLSGLGGSWWKDCLEKYRLTR